MTITGTWTTATTDKGFQGTNYHQHAAAASTTDTFAWRPTISAATSYRVYARWTANANRATNATYTVTHAGGTTQVPINQQQGGGEWNLLGTFNLAPSAGHQVSLSGQGNGIVAADAVKIVAANAATLFYIYPDHIDTPRVIANTANQIRWRWYADPFGTAAAEENPASLGVFNFDWRFPGQYRDKETNLHYNYFRDYDPQVGRYAQSDPIGLRGGLNTYAYVESIPNRRSDPLGLWSTRAHNVFIWYYAGSVFLDLPTSYLNQIYAGSAYADGPAFQGSAYSFMHAMSSRYWSKEKAREMMCKYIAANLNAYRTLLSTDPATAYFHLGMALHSVMDSTSPAHRGFQYWPSISNVARHGLRESWPFSQESEKHIEPYLSETLQLMRAVTAGDLSVCGCQ